MAKTIKRKSDLPKWFSREKYDGATSLDARGWHEQLGMRGHLLSIINSPKWAEWKSSPNPGSSYQQILSILARLRENPFLNIEGDKTLELFFYFGGAIRNVNRVEPRNTVGVHLSTIRDLYC